MATGKMEMGNKFFNKLKLGLAGIVLAGSINSCKNTGETNNSYISQNNETENINKNLTPEKLKENESLIILDAKEITGRECKFSISTQEYFKYKQMNHRNILNNDFREWVTYNDTTIKNIATKLTKGLKSNEKKAQRLLKFVQSHIYDTRIEENQEYIRYPLETIVEHNGDCEDLAILAAALMKSIGIDVILLYHPPEKEFGHIDLAVNGNFQGGAYYEYKNKKYFYANATNSSWSIGEIPKEYDGKEATLYLIK